MRVCIAVAGASGAGKSSFAERLRGAAVLSMDSYFLERSCVDYFMRDDWDTPAAYDMPLISAHVEALLRGERVAVPRFDFRSGCRSQGSALSLVQGQSLVVEGLYAFDAVLAATHRIFIDVGYREMVARCFPRDQYERNRPFVDQLAAMYRRSWEKYTVHLFPQRMNADYVLPATWMSYFPAVIEQSRLASVLAPWRRGQR